MIQEDAGSVKKDKEKEVIVFSRCSKWRNKADFILYLSDHNI